MEKHSGIQHSMSFSSPTVKGRDKESCLLMGNPHKSTQEVESRCVKAFARPFPVYTCFLGLLSLLFHVP